MTIHEEYVLKVESNAAYKGKFQNAYLLPKGAQRLHAIPRPRRQTENGPAQAAWECSRPPHSHAACAGLFSSAIKKTLTLLEKDGMF